jgi:hypothetical protein
MIQPVKVKPTLSSDLKQPRVIAENDQRRSCFTKKPPGRRCPEVRVKPLQLPRAMKDTGYRVVLTGTDLCTDPFHGIGIVESRRTSVEGFY